MGRANADSRPPKRDMETLKSAPRAPRSLSAEGAPPAAGGSDAADPAAGKELFDSVDRTAPPLFPLYTGSAMVSPRNKIQAEPPSRAAAPSSSGPQHREIEPPQSATPLISSSAAMSRASDQKRYQSELPQSATPQTREPQAQVLQEARLQQLCVEMRAVFREELQAALRAPGHHQRSLSEASRHDHSPPGNSMSKGLEDGVNTLDYGFMVEEEKEARAVCVVEDRLDDELGLISDDAELARARATMSVKSADPTLSPQQFVSEKMIEEATREDISQAPILRLGVSESPAGRFKRLFPWTAPMVNCGARAHAWVNSLEEPERTGCVARFIQSHSFELLSILGIILNCAFMVYSTDYEVSNFEGTQKPQLYRTVEIAFLVWFGIELGLRVYVHKAYFYFAPTWKMRLLDTILIILTLWSVLSNHGVGKSVSNWSFMRAIRMLRLLRVARALRAMNNVKQLHALLAAISNSMMTLLWSMLLLTGILWIFSLLFVQQTATYLNSQYIDRGSVDPDVLDSLGSKFGSVWTSMVALFQATTGGEDWSLHYFALEPTGFGNQLMYLAFVAFMQVAVLNIVTGIFVDCALKQMEKDSEEEALEYLNTEHRNEHDLRLLCREADLDNDGRITYDELLKAFQHGKMNMYLDHIGFHHQDVLDYFKILASSGSSGDVDLELFVRGCMRLRGQATRFDMKAVQLELKLIHSDIAQLRQPHKKTAK